MSNLLAFLLGVIIVLIILIVIALVSRRSITVAKAYGPVFCNDVIGQ